MTNLIKNKIVDCAELTKELEDRFGHYDIKSEEESEIFADKIDKFFDSLDIYNLENNYELIKCVDGFTYKKSLENSIC